MTDFASNAPPRRPSQDRATTEYYLYFSLIFVTALPSAFIGWVRDISRRRTLNLTGPLARAWQEADRVTPLIFSV